jgi:type II secretory pathway component PulM
VIEPLVAFYRGLSSRERLLLQVGLFVLVFVVGPLWAWTAAHAFRERAASDLEAAVALQGDVSRLAALQGTQQAPPPIQSDGTPRGLAQALAAQLGLKVSRIDADGPTGLSTALEPASAVAVYRWIDGMERSGLSVTGVVMTRAGEGDVVSTQVRITSGPK